MFAQEIQVLHFFFLSIWLKRISFGIRTCVSKRHRSRWIQFICEWGKKTCSRRGHTNHTRSADAADAATDAAIYTFCCCFCFRVCNRKRWTAVSSILPRMSSMGWQWRRRKGGVKRMVRCISWKEIPQFFFFFLLGAGFSLFLNTIIGLHTYLRQLLICRRHWSGGCDRPNRQTATKTLSYWVSQKIKFFETNCLSNPNYLLTISLDTHRHKSIQWKCCFPCRIIAASISSSPHHRSTSTYPVISNWMNHFATTISVRHKLRPYGYFELNWMSHGGIKHLPRCVYLIFRIGSRRFL